MDFFVANKRLIIYLISDLAVFSILIGLTKLWYGRIEKRMVREFPSTKIKSFLYVKKILISLWVTLGVIGFIFAFLDEDLRILAKGNVLTILYVGIVLVGTILLASFIQLYTEKQVDRKKLEGEDATGTIFAKYALTGGVYLIGGLLIIVAFPSLRGVAQTALGGAGILAAIIGLASKEALGNIVSGIFIIIFKPFKVGDVIKITEDLMGRVHEITLRHTVIRNYQNKMIVIPNTIINQEKLVNYNLVEKKICQWFTIGISYESDIDLARQIIVEACEQHPFLIDNRTNVEIEKGIPKVMVRVVQLGDFSVDLKIWAWARNFDEGFVMKCDLLETIKKRFGERGIEIPYPHRTILIKETGAGPMATPGVEPNGRTGRFTV